MGRGLSDLQKIILKEFAELLATPPNPFFGWVSRDHLLKRLKAYPYSIQAISRSMARLEDRGLIYRDQSKIYPAGDLSSIG